MTFLPFFTRNLEGLRSSTGVLRTVSTEVDFDNDNTDSLVKEFLETFRASKISVGLAAIQVGIPKRFFVINPNKAIGGADTLFINPIIKQLSGSSESGLESCMSLPNLRGPVKRKKKVLIEYSNLRGDRLEESFSGFPARIIQHEMDHLNGILCLDHVSAQHLIEKFVYLTPENYPVEPIVDT